MASLRWLKTRRRWIVRWHITVKSGESARQILKGSKTFARKQSALQFKRSIEKDSLLLLDNSARTGVGLSSAVHGWYRYIEQFTPRTQELYRSVLGRFRNQLPDSIERAADIGTGELRRYLLDLLSHNRSRRTHNCHLTVLKSFCRYLNETYQLDNAAKPLRMLKEDIPEVRFLDEREYRQAILLGDKYYRRWALFLANTGLRVTEFCQLTWDCVKDGSFLVVCGKGRKVRVVPLNRLCRQILKVLKLRAPKHCNHIFLSKNNTPLTRYAVYEKCSRTARYYVGCKKFGPHALRRYFGTQMILAGAQIRLLAEILGHSSIRSTEIYLRILPKHLEGLTECLC